MLISLHNRYDLFRAYPSLSSDHCGAISHASCTSAASLDCHYVPGVAYPPTMNHVRNATATMNTITGKAIPILIKTPVYPCFLYVCGMLPITFPKTKTLLSSSRSIGSHGAYVLLSDITSNLSFII